MHNDTQWEKRDNDKDPELNGTLLFWVCAVCVALFVSVILFFIPKGGL